MRPRKAFIWTVLLTAALLSACQTSWQAPNPTPTPEAVLDFKFKDLDGQTITLSSLQGQVVLLNFWASWCSPCRDEMPLLESFYQAYKDEGFRLVAVNVSEDAADAAAFIEEGGYTFPVWSDPPGNALIELGLRGLPISLVFDAQGQRQLTWIGPFTQDYLDQLVLPLLADN